MEGHENVTRYLKFGAGAEVVSELFGREALEKALELGNGTNIKRIASDETLQAVQRRLETVKRMFGYAQLEKSESARRPKRSSILQF